MSRSVVHAVVAIDLRLEAGLVSLLACAVGEMFPLCPWDNTFCSRARGRISGESQPPLLRRTSRQNQGHGPQATKGELQRTWRVSTLDVMVTSYVKAPRPKGCAVGSCTCRVGAAGRSELWRACLKKSSSPFARRRCSCKQRGGDFKSGSALSSPCGQSSHTMRGADWAARRRQAPSIHLLFGCRVGPGQDRRPWLRLPAQRSNNYQPSAQVARVGHQAADLFMAASSADDISAQTAVWV